MIRQVLNYIKKDPSKLYLVAIIGLILVLFFFSTDIVKKNEFIDRLDKQHRVYEEIIKRDGEQIKQLEESMKLLTKQDSLLTLEVKEAKKKVIEDTKVLQIQLASKEKEYKKLTNNELVKKMQETFGY